MSFTLATQLDNDTIPIVDLTLCRVLLMNNKQFPWLILVPIRHDIRELHDLNADDYQQLMQEIRHCSSVFSTLTGAHKMNIATLGNIVPQLHIHVIARFTDDDAWPTPVWNCAQPTIAYSDAEQQQKVASIKAALT